MTFHVHIHDNSFLTAKQLRKKYTHKEMAKHLVSLYVSQNAYMNQIDSKTATIQNLKEVIEKIKT